MVEIDALPLGGGHMAAVLVVRVLGQEDDLARGQAFDDFAYDGGLARTCPAGDSYD